LVEIASKSFRSSLANVTLYRGAMSSSLFIEDDNNTYYKKCEESATTSRTGGMRKAPKRGR